MNEQESPYRIAVRLEDEQPREAQGKYLQSWRQREEFHDIPYRISKLSYKLGRFRHARKWILIDLQMYPNNASCLHLAKSCMRLNRWDEALSALEQASIRGAKPERVLDLRAVCLLALGRSEELSQVLLGNSERSRLSRVVAECAGLKVESTIVESLRKSLNNRERGIVEKYRNNPTVGIECLLSAFL